MSNKFFLLLMVAMLATLPIAAQRRVIDALDRLPVSTASIFDAAGNVIGLTGKDGASPRFPMPPTPSPFVAWVTSRL